MIHDLKILPEHFWPVVEGIKKAEVRINDRGFEVGDKLHLREFCDEKYTGVSLIKDVIHIADLSSFKEGYVLLSMSNNSRESIGLS